ncbi:MAG: IgA Peptidase M64 [Prevotellaceae bacterium]|nr:IgA Peptidase M64 [Prevotellaceae bacterium]
MKKQIFISTLLCLITFASCGQTNFDKYFENKSMRIDFALVGNYDYQTAALQQIREEPVWGGAMHNLIDKFNYGGYYVNVYDNANGNLIYSRGFNTLFEEWRTTEQAKTETQSWTNSVSFPYPKQKITVDILGRNKDDMQFYSLLKIDIDPSSIFINRDRLKENKVNKIQYNGSTSDKIDLVFMGEGYTAGEQAKFMNDAVRFTELLFKTPPFDMYRSEFNVWAVELVSEESGMDISGKGIFKQTALNSGFYTFGIERYLTTQDMKPIRDAVWNVPCDAVFILVNTDIYGGGGMYNLYAMGTSDNERTASVFVHEFGHSFAGLADEYFTSEVAYDDQFYNLNLEPWEPNITTLTDFDSKWKDLLSPDTPIPTADNRENADKLGVFEGGGYLSKGIYRPKVHCMMRDYAPFCPVCTRVIKNMIDFLSDKH